MRGPPVPEAERAFVALPPFLAWCVFTYGIIFKVAFPALAESMGYGEGSALAPLLILLAGLHWTLASAPMLLLGRSLGIVHPLAFPILFATAKEILLAPSLLLAALFGELHLFAVTTPSTSPGLSDVSFDDVIAARTLQKGIELAAVLAFFAGYLFLAQIRIRPGGPSRGAPVAAVATAALAWSAASFVTLIGFLYARGGLDSHLLKLTAQRYEQFESIGHLMLLIKIAGVAALVLACRGRTMQEPTTMIVLAYALVATFLVDGARSGPIYLALLFFLVTMTYARRLPTVRLSLAALLALASLGAFGLIRQDWNAERVRWEVLRPDQHSVWLEKTFSEVARRRAEEPDVAALARLDESGMLGGRTYLGAALFFVPRSLWPEKPRSAGVYNNHYNFSRTYASGEFPRDWGIPISGATEAYWNFGWAGVITIFVAIGGALRVLLTVARAHGGRGYSAVVLALGLLYLNGSGDGMTRFAQHVSGLAAIAITARLVYVCFGRSRVRGGGVPDAGRQPERRPWALMSNP